MHELYSSGEFDIKLARIRHRHLSRKLEITSSAETMKQWKFQPTHLLIFFGKGNESCDANYFAIIWYSDATEPKINSFVGRSSGVYNYLKRIVKVAHSQLRAGPPVHVRWPTASYLSSVLQARFLQLSGWRYTRYAFWNYLFHFFCQQINF